MSAKFSFGRIFATLRHREWGRGAPSSPSTPATESPGARPIAPAQSPPAGTSERPSRRAPARPHPLRGRVAIATIAVAMVAGSLALTAAPASALSKNTFSTSFGTATSTPPDPVPLTNPTAVAVDQSTGDLYVTDSPENEQQRIVVNATGGYFTLTFEGQTTRRIYTSASTSEVLEILAGLPSIALSYGSSNDVNVTGGFSSGGGEFIVEFTNLLGRLPQPLFTADTSHLGGPSPTVTVTTARPASSVADVEKFSPSGEFLLIFGREVNKTKVEQHAPEAQQNLCTAASGDQCQLGSLGTAPGSFTDPEFLAIDNSGGPSGDVYVGDRVSGPGSGDVQKFDSEGHLIASWGKGGLLDRSSSTGRIFGIAPGSRGLGGIAVDPAGNLFVYSGFRYFEFAPEGAFLRDFAPNPNGAELTFEETGFSRNGASLAVDAADNLYLGPRKFDSSGAFLGIVGGGTDVAIDPASRDLFATSGNEVAHYASFCHFTAVFPNTFEPCTPIDTFGAGHLSGPRGLAVNESTKAIYVADTGDHRVAVFGATPFLPDVTASAQPKAPTEESLEGEVDPAGAPAEITSCSFEYGKEEGSYGEGSAECEPHAPISGTAHPTATFTGLAYGTTYHYRLQVEDSNGLSASYDQQFTTLPEAPKIEAEAATAVQSDFALIAAQLNPGGGEAEFHTHYHVEYIEEEKFKEHEFQGAQQSPSLDAGSARTFGSVSVELPSLKSNTTYHYRLLAENASSPPGGTLGPAHTFTTLPFLTEPPEPCPNAHIRQQTSAAALLDCRAYELVSAAHTRGYDVESNLIAGQSPFGGYPEAEGRLLYGVHGGGIPGTNHPTNRGLDPYLATRGQEGWSTQYVGIPANATPSTAPFSSTLLEADAGLDTFAFGGPAICQPCFADGSTGQPLHLPNGELIQGMAGPLPQPEATPAGYVAKPLSADGSHFLFGSTSKFEPTGEEGSISIYDRNLTTEETHVVSKAPGGGNLPCLTNCQTDGIGELAVSKDGSHVLIGQLVEEAGAAKYWHLFINVGDSEETIDLTPTATKGVLFDGMTADGSKVFFSSVEHLTNEDTSHTGADIYMWEEGHPLTLISKGDGNSCEPVANSAHEHWNATGATEESCGVVAIGGGGGVSSADGTVYFLSPETLAGSGNAVQNAPNLYRASPDDGYAPHYVTTLESALTGPQPPKRQNTFGRNLSTFFSNATALAVDHSSGDLYVLDAGTNTVDKFDSEGNPVEFTAGPGHGTNQMDGSETPAGSFVPSYFGVVYSSQLAIDQSSGDFYVPDTGNNAIDKFKPNGELEKAFGEEGKVEVSYPTAATIDPANGELYVSKFFGGVEVFSSSGKPEAQLPIEGLLTSLAVDPTSGDVYVTQFEANGGEAEVYGPAGSFLRKLDPHLSNSVTVDPSTGDVYVNEGSQLVRYDSSGHPIATLDTGHLTGSLGVAIDPEGNLYATTAGGAEVAVFASSLAPSPLVDNPLVIDSVSEPQARHTADFQTTPDGHFAAFPSTLALTGKGEEAAGHTVLYRYDAATEVLACVSCTLTGIPSTGDSSLASNGTSLTDDGRVFFNSADQLVSADTDEKQDAYEWAQEGAGNCAQSNPSFVNHTGTCLALISTGTSPFDSGLLGVSADGTDAYFFTRDSLVPSDKNGPTMKVYDARAEGGFPFEYPPVPCKASDECHGASSPVPPPIQAGSEAGSPHNFEEESKGCKKGYVKKHGHCVKKPKHHKHHKRGGVK